MNKLSNINVTKRIYPVETKIEVKQLFFYHQNMNAVARQVV